MKRAPIDVILRPIDTFMQKENTSSIILFVSLLVALFWVNSPWAHYYHSLWDRKLFVGTEGFILNYSIHHWINDGLMTVFFFVVGMELKREFISGELASPKKAILPIFAAVGGMVVPAILYAVFNKHTASASGWGIPMATDIAFAIGLLSFVNSKVPIGVKVFLTALAIADDLGAVLVIAFFYTTHLSLFPLAIAGTFLGILLAGNILGVRSIFFYCLIGIAGVWLPFLLSGVHATIAGVLVAFVIPTRTKINEKEYSRKIKDLNDAFQREIPNNGTLLTEKQHQLLQLIEETTTDAETPLQKLEHRLHPWVAFVIMPLFALSNAGMEINSNFFSALNNVVTAGIVTGLVAGKFVGVLLFSFILVKLNIASLPGNTKWAHMAGAAIFAGIGFTMSLFIAGLAFTDAQLIEQAKYGILIASTLAALSGLAVFKFFIKPVGGSKL